VVSFIIRALMIPVIHHDIVFIDRHLNSFNVHLTSTKQPQRTHANQVIYELSLSIYRCFSLCKSTLSYWCAKRPTEGDNGCHIRDAVSRGSIVSGLSSIANGREMQRQAVQNVSPCSPRRIRSTSVAPLERPISIGTFEMNDTPIASEAIVT